MAKISLSNFKGRKPKVSSILLPKENSVTAININLESGSIQSDKDYEVSQDLGATDYRSIHMPGSSTGWITLTTMNIDFVDANIDESDDMFFWTDGVMPKYSTYSTYPTSYRLGVKPPTAIPTITHNKGTPDPDGDVQAYVSYVYTMVDTHGWESAPSTATAVDTIYTGEGVTIGNMLTPTGTNCNYEYKRIYRLESGLTGAVYLYLDEIDVTDTNYEDWSGTGLNTTSTDAISTTDWDAPPNDLIGLTSGWNGMIFGFVGKELYVSEPHVPYAFPSNKTIVFENDIVGLGTTGESLVVLTKKYNYVVFGSEPANMGWTKVSAVQQCLFKKSIVSTERGVFYISADGLCLCDGNSTVVVTRDFIDKETWSGYNPSQQMGVWYDDKYICFKQTSNWGMVIDPTDQTLELISCGDPCSKMYDVFHRAQNDTIYVLARNNSNNNSAIFSMWTSENKRSWYWTSKELVDKYNYTCARILGDYNGGTESATIKYWLDDVLVLLHTAYSNAMFRLPALGYKEKKQIELYGNADVYSVEIATAPEDLI